MAWRRTLGRVLRSLAGAAVLGASGLLPARAVEIDLPPLAASTALASSAAASTAVPAPAPAPAAQPSTQPSTQTPAQSPAQSPAPATSIPPAGNAAAPGTPAASAAAADKAPPPLPRLTRAAPLATTGPAKPGGAALLLCLDRSGSMGAPAIAAMQKALRESLPPGSAGALPFSVGITVFGTQTQVLLGLTDDAARVAAAITALGLDRERDGKTRLHDAVAGGLAQLRATDAASRHLIVVSDGSDEGSDISQAELIRRVTATAIPVDAISFGKLSASRGGSLATVAGASGGSFLTARNDAELRSALGRLVRLSLGTAMAAAAPPGAGPAPSSGAAAAAPASPAPSSAAPSPSPSAPASAPDERAPVFAQQPAASVPPRRCILLCHGQPLAVGTARHCLGWCRAAGPGGPAGAGLAVAPRPAASGRGSGTT